MADISRETGLNRNTVTALYYNKIDGIKFDTIEKLMKTYDLELTDILDAKKSSEKDSSKDRRYKQEAVMAPFYAWPAFLAFNDLPKEYFGSSLKNGSVYFKDDYAVGYWDFHAMKDIASFVYEKRSTSQKLNALYELYLSRARNLEDVYSNISSEMISKMEKEEFNRFFADFQEIYKKFWQYSLFLDTFDIGFDFEKIAEISNKYSFSKEEVEVLTTPCELTFNNERELELLGIAKQLKRRKKAEVSDIREFVEKDPAVREYRLKFDYYKSNYANVEHISLDEIAEQLSRYIETSSDTEKRWRELQGMPIAQAKKIERILKKYKLEENPLYFFNKLTYWREHRKKVNLMGFHVLERILIAIEKETGISLDVLRYLTFEEVKIALVGLVFSGVLRNRKEKGFYVDITEQGLKMIEGEEALSLKEEREKQLHEKDGDRNIIFGKTASQGYAKGKAKIILDQKNFYKLQEGDILVTSMTRPEFLPLMKKAAGIVTNEGGITCHAAIVSRELGKPCIIGTQNATERIKDGDLIEVRANHGTVRILERKQ